MSNENEDAIDQQIRQWAEDYERLFESDSVGDDVPLSDDELIPLDEMRGYVDKYVKLFGDEDSVEEQKRKLARLKKIREGWKLHHKLLDLLIEVREKQLSQY